MDAETDAVVHLGRQYCGRTGFGHPSPMGCQETQRQVQAQGIDLSRDGLSFDDVETQAVDVCGHVGQWERFGDVIHRRREDDDPSWPTASQLSQARESARLHGNQATGREDRTG
ncbi:hypothetical protein GQ85_15850 [Rhodococcus rhodochrous]|nr:hypothetical protein GY12_19930 [Micrococcus luteus]KFC52795.1 hypothetical protein GY12_00170 [Micrococcus luteus]KZE67892.1 hypothetical protein AWM60_09120 [Micrococcus aloeverae]OOL31076.1 hypothetical protein GQ85_15850 [Rhodococcus rhodochrous]